MYGFQQPDAWISNLGVPDFNKPVPLSTPPRVPQMSIQAFSGDPQDWPSFIAGFKILIHDACSSDAERLYHLRNSLRQDVRDRIGDTLLHPSLYQHALKELHRKYGNPQLIAHACNEKLMALSAFKEDDYRALQKFSAKVRGVVCMLKYGGYESQLGCYAIIQQLAAKLPVSLRKSWGKKSWSLQPRLPTLVDFDNWLDESYMEESRAQTSAPRESSRDRQHRDRHAVYNIFPVETNAAKNQSLNECPAGCKEAHQLDRCQRFKDLSPEKRAQIIKGKKLCFRCLKGGHRSIDCSQDKNCPIEGCRYRHHVLLHGAPVMWKSNPKPYQQQSKDSYTISQFCGFTYSHDDYTFLPIVPIIVRAKGKEFKTYGLLDRGSRVTLIRDDVYTYLSLEGEWSRSKFGTFHAQDPFIRTRKVRFTITPLNRGEEFNVDGAYSIDRLNIRRRSVPPTALINWPHLRDIKLQEIDGGEVTVLIGMDLTDAHDVVESRREHNWKNAPMALSTPFGWCVVGKLDKAKPTGQHKICDVFTLNIEERENHFRKVVQNFITGEMIGTHPNVKAPAPQSDVIALQKIEMSIRHNGERYEIGLPFKSTDPHLPNNFSAAFRRLRSLEEKFRSDPPFALKYASNMAEYVALGHAREISRAEADATPPGKFFYLPHHGVVNPQKPGKVRTVFDASARFNGVSLNDRLLKGPDLLTSLVGLLIRFRRAKFPVTADIEKMFHQVKVSPRDRPALRYLWREPGSLEQPKIMEMQVQIFGAVSSPTICSYALRRTGADNEKDFPGVTDRIVRYFYVDNYMESFDDQAEAIYVSKQLRECLLRGGFKLTQWASADKGILSSLSEPMLAKPTLNLDMDDLPTERTLGLTWNCQSDTFELQVKVPTIGTTKRDLLRSAASVFDPLGFLAPVMFITKQLLRDAWETSTTWDETLDRSIIQRWEEWNLSLESLSQINLQRCYKSTNEKPTVTELHAFSDASEKGYGAVVYIRTQFRNRVEVAFVIAKSRISPKKPITIPRLELNGALVAYRLIITVKAEIDATIDSVTIWTDSTTVLRWLTSEHCRYHSYVANRIGEMLETKNANNWRYVPSKENPADDCCRGVSPKQITNQHRWFQGPDFLKDSQENWPTSPIYPYLTSSNEVDPEVKKDDSVDPRTWVGLTGEAEANRFETLMERRSSIDLIVRTTAYIQRLFNIFPQTRREKTNNHILSTELSTKEISAAKQFLIKLSQQTHFSQEIICIINQRPIPPESQLAQLSPFLDHEGILRVGGRIQRAEAPYSVRHPILLHPKHRFTTLVIQKLHNDLAHATTEYMLSNLRSTYWVLKGRSTIKSVISPCLLCRRRNAKPAAPYMAALPACRLSSHNPAFTHTGVDMFGPLMVKMFRRQLKRYGIMFTCMTTRAVHLEMVESMDMDSFLRAYSRFIVHKGKPTHCYSDNGTNFTSAAKEISDGLASWNKAEFISKEAARQTTWHFNPPYAPHFGGAWERLIRSAKTALAAVLHGQTTTDEVLRTALTLVEGLLNSRPLTHVSVDPHDPEALTPYHLLIGRANPYVPLNIVDERDVNCRQRYRAALALAKQFWRRWLREYLPRQIERRKWLEHRRNLKIGDIVLVVDSKSAEGHWPLGKVTEVFIGTDGVVRSAKVATQHGEYHKAVVKLCLLEEEERRNVFSSENRVGRVKDAS